MKLIYAVIDGGCGNEQSPDMMAADLRYLDKFAKEGVCGIVHVIKGVAPESDSAVISLLGHDPKEFPSKRGPLEAIGAGLKFSDGMLALRCNFACSLNGTSLVSRRVMDLKPREISELERTLNRIKIPDVKINFKATVAHRGVVIFSSNKYRFSDNISNVDPAYIIRGGISTAAPSYPKRVLKAKPLDKTKESKVTAEIVNEFVKKAFEVLRDHPVNKRRLKKGLLPANTVLCRDAGVSVPKLQDLSTKYERKFGVIAEMPLEVGIGKIAGMSVIKTDPPKFTKADYSRKAKQVLDALKRYDVIYVHLKGPDIFGHRKDLEGKVESLEMIDRYFFGKIYRGLGDNAIIVTCDHATPSELGYHTADPVPILFYYPGIKPDSCERFDEISVRSGRLKLQGPRVLSHFIEIVDKKSKKR
jgi:2,3-bisphosphoglycerate-independent phosphoglycerate mutase